MIIEKIANQCWSYCGNMIAVIVSLIFASLSRNPSILWDSFFGFRIHRTGTLPSPTKPWAPAFLSTEKLIPKKKFTQMLAARFSVSNVIILPLSPSPHLCIQIFTVVDSGYFYLRKVCPVFESFSQVTISLIHVTIFAPSRRVIYSPGNSPPYCFLAHRWSSLIPDLNPWVSVYKYPVVRSRRLSLSIGRVSSIINGVNGWLDELLARIDQPRTFWDANHCAHTHTHSGDWLVIWILFLKKKN